MLCLHHLSLSLQKSVYHNRGFHQSLVPHLIIPIFVISLPHSLFHSFFLPLISPRGCTFLSSPHSVAQQSTVQTKLWNGFHCFEMTNGKKKISTIRYFEIYLFFQPSNCFWAGSTSLFTCLYVPFLILLVINNVHNREL